jgi:hypothetical protein
VLADRFDFLTNNYHGAQEWLHELRVARL